MPRYLGRTLALSPAAVIVVLGREARQQFRTAYHYPDPGVVSPPLDIEGTARTVVFLSHPRSVERRGATLRYPKRLQGSELEHVRSVLAHEIRGRKYRSEAGDIRIIRWPQPPAAR